MLQDRGHWPLPVPVETRADALLRNSKVHAKMDEHSLTKQHTKETRYLDIFS
jgi:hypothetical protein